MLRKLPIMFYALFKIDLINVFIFQIADVSMSHCVSPAKRPSVSMYVRCTLALQLVTLK